MTVIDLFAGPGGWDVAARELGLDPIGFEIDEAANKTRAAVGFRTDARDVAAVDLREFQGGYPVTGLLASPPCQAFSSAGKQKGKADIPKIRRAAIQLAHGRDHRGEHDWADERAPLVLEPLRWALALQPEWMCWEQVPPVLPFWELCAKLLARRYSVWTGLLHAEQFGVPQTRKRAFLIASRVGAVAPPAPTHSRYYPRDKARLDDGVEKWVSMAEALGWHEGLEPAPAPTVSTGGTGGGGGVEVFAGAHARRRAELAVPLGGLVIVVYHPARSPILNEDQSYDVRSGHYFACDDRDCGVCGPIHTGPESRLAAVLDARRHAEAKAKQR